MAPSQLSRYRRDNFGIREGFTAKRIMCRSDFSENPRPNSNSNCLPTEETTGEPYSARFSFRISRGHDARLANKRGQAGIDGPGHLLPPPRWISSRDSHLTSISDITRHSCERSLNLGFPGYAQICGQESSFLFLAPDDGATARQAIGLEDDRRAAIVPFRAYVGPQLPQSVR